MTTDDDVRSWLGQIRRDSADFDHADTWAAVVELCGIAYEHGTRDLAALTAEHEVESHIRKTALESLEAKETECDELKAALRQLVEAWQSGDEEDWGDIEPCPALDRVNAAIEVARGLL